MFSWLFNFGIFWGVWLIAPILIDGFTALTAMLAVLWGRIRRKSKIHTLNYFPFISVIIPVYNSEDTLDACLTSLRGQDYPPDRIEIILVNNGSTDDSFRIFSEKQGEFGVPLSWHSIINKGKAWALNAGIHLSRGNYIFNVDSDVVLHPLAIYNIVEAMESEPDLGAVTGAIQVLPPPEGASRLQEFLGACEQLEYITAFHVGREHQTILQSIYTLSGAFSVFRREVLLETFLYNQETVTEDTDLTFDIYERVRDARIGCISSAVAYVHPIESLRALYAQRVRWQRGQIEVTARHPRLMEKSLINLRGFSPKRVLMIDHTLAFPRFVWTFLIPVLGLFGYPLSLIVLAMFVLYVFYLCIDLLWLSVAWMGIDQTARTRLKEKIWIVLFMPAYRMVIFWFRFSGFLHALAEPGEWTVRDPVLQIKEGIADVRQKTEDFILRIFNSK